MIQFKLIYATKGLYLHGRKRPITYTYGGPHNIKILFKNRSKKTCLNNDECSTCITHGTFKASTKNKKILLCISRNILPEEMKDNSDAVKYLENTAKSVERIDLKYFPQPCLFH